MKEEISYIISVNDFLFILSEIVDCGLDIKNKNSNKLISIAKYILLGLNLYMKDNQNNYDDDIVVSENYIETYYNDVLKIATSPDTSLDLKSIFLNAGIYFMTTFDGYDNILFQNGLFHSFLNYLTHQNGNEMEVLNLKDGKKSGIFEYNIKFCV